MKKPYQIETQRAVRQFEAMAADGNPAVQMMLPMAEMVGWLRKGVGELVRQAGLQLMDLLMQEEVRDLVGERSQRQAERTANRWGSERGYCVVMGQKVRVERPRVRTTDDKEVRLGSYEMFHRGEPLTETIWAKLMLGLSTRTYGQAVRQFTEAYGLEKSAVSEHFIEASRTKLKDMMERRLDKMRLCALLIDATPFEGQQMVAALGIAQDGRKTILGIRQGATENATVVGELLGDLVNRGLDFTEPRLYVLDGGKGLGRSGEEVRRRIGCDPALPSPQAPERSGPSDRRTETDGGQKAQCGICLERLRGCQASTERAASRTDGPQPKCSSELGRRHGGNADRPPASRPESAFSIVERVCRNVKRWHGGDQRERWVGSGLLVAQKQFRRITGYKQIPALIRELETPVPTKTELVKRKKAS